MPSVITVNSTDSYHAACVAGLGIIQSPRSGELPSIVDDEMVAILPNHTCEPVPLFLFHAHGRNVPRQVRVVMSWLAEIIRTPLD
jgi:DNA-binding transcriptional LysR family regulator